MSDATAGASKAALKTFRSPQMVISRFVFRRSVRSAIVWALVFGIYLFSKADGFAATYPTPQSRVKVITSFANNIGIKAILGAAPHTGSISALAAWNTLAVMIIIGAIWALLTATRSLRGEEQSGRWELLLSGQTTARGATCNVLAGLGFSLVTLYVVTALAFIGIGHIHTIDFGVASALYFAFTVVIGGALFMAIGALSSELMPTRAQAASLASVVFGACYLIRAVADTTSATWLLNITPLGWIEKAEPLNGSYFIWLILVLLLTLVLCILTVWLAGRRDLGTSIIADKATAKPHYGLLNSPLTMAARLTRGATIGWLAAVSVTSLMFGALTKAAATAFTQSATVEKTLKTLSRNVEASAATSFLGIAFLLFMLLIMCYAASSMGAVREDEASGYVDNLLVRSVSRSQWLFSRVIIITTVIILAGIASALFVWLSIFKQHLGVSFQSIFFAGINTIAPALLTLGIGVLFMGIIPRLTTIAAYALVAWSFLITMISSGVHINHWLQDTSILQNVALSPVTNPKWSTNAIILLISLGCMMVGAYVFNKRDIQPE